jgi:hypothetical protein
VEARDHEVTVARAPHPVDGVRDSDMHSRAAAFPAGSLSVVTAMLRLCLRRLSPPRYRWVSPGFSPSAAHAIRGEAREPPCSDGPDTEFVRSFSAHSYPLLSCRAAARFLHPRRPRPHRRVPLARARFGPMRASRPTCPTSLQCGRM